MKVGYPICGFQHLLQRVYIAVESQPIFESFVEGYPARPSRVSIRRIAMRGFNHLRRN